MPACAAMMAVEAHRHMRLHTPLEADPMAALAWLIGARVTKRTGTISPMG
jgi:hypothetical protein